MHRLHNPSLALFLLRIGLGVVFVYHGYQNFSTMDQTVGYFATIGISTFWTYVAVYTELIGGALLILGLWVRYAGMFLTVLMGVAINAVHLKHGFSLSNGGYEYALLLLLGSASLVFSGSGRYSLAHYIRHSAFCRDCHIGVHA